MTTSFYASRSNPNIESSDESYSTIDIYLNSQIGTVPLAGYTNINTGFTCQLANPIVLDISHRYVIALIKKQFDVSQYTTVYRNFSIYCDLCEYQYENNQKTQLLYKSYAHRYLATSEAYQDMNPALSDVMNVAWKFINPTQKVIKEISFWILDDQGNPLVTPVAPEQNYATCVNILIKKVNSHVVAVSAL